MLIAFDIYWIFNNSFSISFGSEVFPVKHQPQTSLNFFFFLFFFRFSRGEGRGYNLQSRVRPQNFLNLFGARNHALCKRQFDLILFYCTRYSGLHVKRFVMNEKCKYYWQYEYSWDAGHPSSFGAHWPPPRTCVITKITYARSRPVEIVFIDPV